MKIAISQSEYNLGNSELAHDCLTQDWYSFVGHHEIIPVPNINSPTFHNFDMLILSGGNATAARLRTEMGLFNYAVQNNIPVLGVCHGAFFIAQTTGAEVIDIEGHRNVEHIVKLDGRNVIVNSFHGSTITRLGADYDAIAIDTEGYIEGFKHKDKPIWGLLWHPERQEVPMLPEAVNDLLQVNDRIFNQNFDWMDAL